MMAIAYDDVEEGMDDLPSPPPLPPLDANAHTHTPPYRIQPEKLEALAAKTCTGPRGLHPPDLLFASYPHTAKRAYKQLIGVITDTHTQFQQWVSRAGPLAGFMKGACVFSVCVCVCD
jgi:hypothetical protein